MTANTTNSIEYVGAGGALGTIVGQSATELVGFYGTTAVVQRASAAQVALSIITVSTTSGRGFNTSAGFDDMIAQLEEIRAALVGMGILKGSA